MDTWFSTQPFHFVEITKWITEITNHFSVSLYSTRLYGVWTVVRKYFVIGFTKWKNENWKNKKPWHLQRRYRQRRMCHIPKFKYPRTFLLKAQGDGYTVGANEKLVYGRRSHDSAATSNTKRHRGKWGHQKHSKKSHGATLVLRSWQHLPISWWDCCNWLPMHRINMFAMSNRNLRNWRIIVSRMSSADMVSN